MTKSKKARAYLAKHPEATAKDIQERFNTSVSMSYRLINEARTAATTDQEVANYFDNLEARTAALQFLEEAKKPVSITVSVANPEKTNIIEKVVGEVTDDNVNHPSHYKIGGIETIDFIEAKGLDNHYHLANAIKYISRAPYKNNYLEDIKKATWYLQREIARCETPDFLR